MSKSKSEREKERETEKQRKRETEKQRNRKQRKREREKERNRETEKERKRIGLKGVHVEQDGEVRVTSVHNELIGDVRNVITGFFKNNRMELSTGRRNDIGGVPAGQSWIPLKNRETVLMMHEIAVGCINVTKPVRFGLPKI